MWLLTQREKMLQGKKNTYPVFHAFRIYIYNILQFVVFSILNSDSWKSSSVCYTRSYAYILRDKAPIIYIKIIIILSPVYTRYIYLHVNVHTLFLWALFCCCCAVFLFQINVDVDVEKIHYKKEEEKKKRICVIKIRINKYEYAMINNTNPFPSSSPNNPCVCVEREKKIFSL